MEELFSIQALVHYYDKSSVDHAAVKRLLLSAKIDSLQLLLSDGSTTTLQNYVLIPRLERPSVSDVISVDGEAPATVAAVVMLAEARAAADSIASSSLELDIACSALERLLGSLTSRARNSGAMHLGNELSIDTCTLNRIYRNGLIRRHRSNAKRVMGDAGAVPVSETPSSILTAVNARLRLCDLATHCLAVVARQCVTSEDKCREAVVLSTRLLSLAVSLANSGHDASTSSSFSSRNSLRTALISGAIHIGVIVSENFDIDISPWIRNANHLMLNNSTGSGRTQVIAAVFGGMIPSCSEYRNVHTSKTASRVMMPLSILHSVLEEQLEKTSNTVESKMTQTPKEGISRPESNTSDSDKISKAAQSFLGERVVAAEEDGDEGRISGASGYNACENYIKRAGEGTGIRDLLCSLLLSAVSHYSTIQAQLPQSSFHLTGSLAEDTDALSDGCTSNSEGHPGSIDLFDHRIHMRAFGYRPSSSASDSEQELGRTLSLHREVAVLCIEALSTWLTLEYLSTGYFEIEEFYSLLETVCLNASTLLVSKSISTFDVRAALANYGTVCGSILSQMRASNTRNAEFWDDVVQKIAQKSRHCVVLMKPLLGFAEKSSRAKGMFSCYVTDFLCFDESNAQDETKQKSSEDYLLYMMSLVSKENALDLLRVFSILLFNSSAIRGDSSSPSRMRHYAISVHILDFLAKLAYGLNPSKSTVQISIVRLCHRAVEGSDTPGPEEITSQNEITIEDVANLTPPEHLRSSVQSILPVIEEVLLRMTSQVLNPIWSIVLFNGQERIGSRASFSRVSAQKDLADAGEALLEAFVVLQKTMDTLLGQRQRDPPVHSMSTLKDDPVACFFEASTTEGPEGELLKSLISELQSALMAETPISVSLLFRLECAAKALRCTWRERKRQDVDIYPSLIEVLYGCLKQFAEPLAMEDSQELPGFLGKSWYEELDGYAKSMVRDNFSPNDVHSSPVHGNLATAINYCGHIRSGDVESVVKGLLTELALLIPSDASCLGSSAENDLSMLCDIVCQCWPKYTNIAAKIYNLLKDCVGQVLRKHDAEKWDTKRDLTGTLITLSSWRLFIEKAATCSRTLHVVCHLADMSNSSKDFDDDALVLALMDTSYSNYKDIRIPLHVLQSFRPNSLPALISNLLIPQEEAAVAVQSHARSLECFTAACKRNSAWCNALISCLEEYVPKGSELGSTFPVAFFFHKVLTRSVIDSAIMSTAVFDLIDVLAKHGSKSSAIVLETLFRVSSQLFEDQLLLASNDSLYRLLELLIRVCVSYEDIISNKTWGSLSRMYFLADFVKLLVSCLSKLKETVEFPSFTDKQRRLVITMMGLLHICRNGLFQDSTVQIECEKSEATARDESQGHAESKSEPDQTAELKLLEETAPQEESRGSASDGDQRSSGVKAAKENLCTFTTTGSDFVEQHWYFCYTCGLTGTEGVCKVCAAICHDGHDISYSRHSRFFCDCGASGNEAKTIAAVANPAGSSDSEASTRSGRKDNCAESNSSTKRRKCLCLKTEESDSSEAASPSSSEAEVGLDASECDDQSEKPAPCTGDFEMSLLCAVAPLIERCLSSYAQEAKESEETTSEFERSISSMETVNCALDLAQCLLGSGNFFSGKQDLQSSIIPGTWNPLPPVLDKASITKQVITKPVKAAVQPLARIVKILKGGPFSIWGGSGSVRERNLSHSLVGGFPMAMSCFNEHFAVGQEDGSIIFFDTAAVLTCKSALEKSSIEHIGEISVPFPVRYVSFHPDDDETLLVVGDSAVCIVIVSPDPFLEKARVDIELGLSQYGGGIVSSEPHDLSHPPNVLFGADWISYRECALLVKTRAFVKVFDVDKDNVSPALFVPIMPEYIEHKNALSHAESCEEANNNTSPDVAKNTNRVVDIIPLGSWEESEDGSQGLVKTTLLACTRNGDLLFAHRGAEAEELVFTSVLNILSILSWPEEDQVSVIALAKGYNPGIVWIACGNGSLLCICLLVQQTKEGPQSSIRSIHHFINAFEPVSSGFLVPLKCSSEGILLYQKGKSLSVAGVFILDEDMNLSKRFFSGGASSNVMGAICFLPSVVFEKPCCAGGFLASDDGCMYRMDLNFESAQHQFLNDTEMSEISSTLEDMRIERTLSKQNSKNRKGLIQDRYNPVPSTIGYFEKCRPIGENMVLSYSPGAEHGDGSDPDTKVNLGGNTVESIISPIPYATFQFNVAVETSGVLVGARLKFGGSPRSANRIPQSVRVFGREVRWISRNGVKRWLDIPFTVLESAQSPKEVSFELEPQKGQMSESSGFDGLVAVDAIQLFEVSQAEFEDRKLAFDKDAEAFKKSAENPLPNDEVSLDIGEDVRSKSERERLSTLHLFKNFDPRYATALAAIEIACQARELSLESSARLSLTIGAHCLQLVQGAIEAGTSPLPILEENCRRLLREAFKSEFEKYSRSAAAEHIVTSFLDVTRKSTFRSVNQKVINGILPRAVDVEIALYSLRVVSRLWFLLHSSKEETSNAEASETLSSCVPTADVVIHAFDTHMRNSQASRRLYMSPRRVTENAVDTHLILLAASISNKGNPVNMSHAKSLVRMFCDSSQSIRLFSTRRLVYILQDTARLGGISKQLMDTSEDDALKCAHCCDMGNGNSWRSDEKEAKSGEGAPTWAYRCDNCADVCEKEWWHCMDCEDFDLCTKCVRLNRSDLSSHNDNSHIFVRGDPEHNLDELNNAAAAESLNDTDNCFLHHGFSVIMAELAKMKKDRNPTYTGPIFFDAAQMISSIIGPHTGYPTRYKYMEQLCASKEFVSRVLNSVSDVVTQFDAMKAICHLNDIARVVRDWDFAFLFLQVFANVRDSLLLPYLFRCGIPEAFAAILKKLEPIASEIFRHAISCSSDSRGGEETKMGTFEKFWSYRSCTMPIVPDDDSSKVGCADIISPGSPFIEDENICPSVSSFLQLTVYIVDFLSFALQSASGPDVDSVHRNVPRGILCDLVSSESRDPRLKGNPELQRLIQLARKLLLAVNGMDEAQMHRVIDTHVYHAHVGELKRSVQEACDSQSKSKYTIQVEVATTLKSLHRLVSKRPSTWREFSTQNPICLEAIYNASLICDSQSEGTALQLMATACSISKEMAAESVRSSAKVAGSSRSTKSDGSPPKPQKIIEDARHDPDVGKTHPNVPVASEDDVRSSNSRNEWIHLCAQSCNKEKQVELDLFSRNSFAVLKRLIFVLLLQRQSSLVRTSCSRILCCIIARAAISNDDDFVLGMYSVLLVALRRMPSAGALGVELGQSLEVFLGFCYEDYFKCLGADRVARVAALLVDALRVRAASLVSHPNAHIYKALASIVDLQGYYLEAEPCATCSTEAFESAPPTTHRLEAIRVEAKFTDSEIMCRLVSAQAVSGVSVKVVDPRRTRRVKKIDLFYSPRIVTDSAELKSANHPWRQFASIALTPSQLESKVELAVPISTANLRFCFSEFYSAEEASSGSGTEREQVEQSPSNSGEEAQRSTEGSSRGNGNAENLQCPRCSRSVTDRHGICRNCHENAFQCRQCRNINYENLDGFLCNECGYCKHGRFEFSVSCKSSFVAEKVVCEEDRKRASLVIEKETMEVHRRHEQLKKMRSTVVQALSLGPKGFGEPEISTDDPRTKPSSITPNITSSRADIAALEALLGGQLVVDTGEAVPPAAEGAGSSEGNLDSGLGALDLSSRRERDNVRTSSHPFSFLTNQGVVMSRHVVTAINSASLSRQTSLLAVLYSKECKSLFLSMSQSIRVLSATRSELMKYAGNSLKRSAPDSHGPESHDALYSSYCGDTSDMVGGINSSPCYGCTQSFLSICVDLLYTIVRFGGNTATNIKNADLALELLRLSSLCERKEVQMRIRRLIVHIVSDNEVASEVVCKEVSRKIEFCIDSFASIDARSIARVELAVLEDIAHIEDRHWEKRFRTVLQLLFRASRTSLSCASVAETIVLPCLRIALHLLRADEGSIPLHVEELRCIGNLQPRSAGGAETGSGKGIMESSPTRSLGILDSIPSNSNGRAAALESEYASTETPPVDVVGVTQGEVIPRQIGDGADSCTSSERRNPYRLESDQMSCSGAPSSIGTGFEEHGSDEDYQSKLTSRNVLDLNGVMASLKEAHGAHESTVNVERWLGGYQTHEEWISAMADRRSLEQGKTEEEQSDLQKTRRYFQKWRFLSGNMPTAGSSDGDISWAVRLILLAPCARVRQLASSLLQALISNEEILVLRLIDVLTEKSLEKAVTVGDGSREFFDLLNKLISPRSNRLYLIAKGFSLRLAKMIFSEAQRLLHVENSLNGMLAFSLSHGFVLHKVVSVLKLLLDEISKMRTAVRVKIFEVEGGVIVRSLQQAYLFIRRLISLRTRLTDECGNTLCEILSSSDYLFFSPTGVIVVQACVSELKSAHDQDDVQTVAVLLEQLCSMLCPETTEPVCYLTLNKAPTQDEYIRGSMTKNPYSSSSFSGPLMRDVKNKICQDLDLPGLLEDDFAMELLVAGNVIKLDLPIMDVYEQVWRGSPVAAMAASSPTLQRNFGSRGSSISGISTGSTMHPLDVFSASRRRGAPPGRSGNLPEERPDPPMVVVYRLSGLDGEATEPIIDALETDSQEDLDLEALYKSTEILGDVGGLEVLLALLSVVGSWGDDAETAVREPALKLLRACCEVSKNRSILAATPGTLSILLDCAASAFEHAHDSVVAVESAESLLIASEKILAVQSLGQVGDSLQEVPEYDTPIQANVSEILARIQVFLGRLSVVSSSKAEASILHLLPFLIQGIPAAVQAAIEHFSFDWSHVDQVEKHQNMARQFATVLLAAPRDYRGQAIVLRALQEGCAADAVKYLLNEFPLPKTSNKETWDVSLTHPGPPAALKLLTGLAHGCGPASVRRNEIRALVEAGLALSDTTIPVLCQLEMTASSNSIGSITEELLEALKEDEGIADAVDRERRNLKAARRAAALASRQAILKETGLSLLEAKPATGEPSKSIFGSEMFDNVVDEVGPACVVCGDGFKSRPDEALGVYVLNRRVPLDCSITAVLASFKSSSNTVAVLGRPTSRRDADHSGSSRSRSTAGSSSTSFCYTTVSQFNAIHISCHREAARSDRSARREEWEGATLRNSQTICNNIIPIQPPMTCTSTPAKGKDSTSGVFNSTAAAVEYYFNRLLSLGRTNLPYPKVGLYDLGRALIRFADGGTQVFSEHSKGGGPHSNACLIPHLVQLILFTLDTSSSPSSPRVALSKNPHVLSQITELQKYLREERTGDIGFYLSASVVLHSPSQWSESMPKFLRLALREVEIPAIALRLIAFTDAVHLVLKSGMVNESFIDSLKEHIGKDEAFSGTFADTVTDLWEKRIKNIKTKNDFWETVSWSSEYYSANSKGEQCRPVKFEGSVKKIDV